MSQRLKRPARDKYSEKKFKINATGQKLINYGSLGPGLILSRTPGPSFSHHRGPIAYSMG